MSESSAMIADQIVQNSQGEPQAQPSEQVPQGTTPPAEQTQQPMSMSVIAKMEKANRQREAQWKAKEKEYEELRKWKESQGSLEQKLLKLKENPLEVLEETGWDLEKLAKLKEESGSTDPITSKIKEQTSLIASLQEKIEKLEGGLKSKEEQEKKYTEELYNREIKTFIDQGKEKYEFLSVEDDGIDMVKELIKQDLIRQAEEGKTEDEMEVITLDNACQLIEQKLDEYYSKRLTLNKVQSRIGTKPSRTLGADFTTTTQPAAMSEEENIQRAVEFVKTWRE